jgi:hypothetical protein
MANVPHIVYYKVNGTGAQLTKEYMAENRDAAESLFQSDVPDGRIDQILTTVRFKNTSF